MARLSGLQREVLSLYRKCLRETRKKPLVGTTLPFSSPLALVLAGDTRLLPGIKEQFQELCSVCLCCLSRRSIGALRTEMNARAEFQKHLSVNKKDFGAIEYLLRKGHRQLEMYASPGIRNIR